MVNETLAKLGQDFNKLYADWGRVLMPPEKLLLGNQGRSSGGAGRDRSVDFHVEKRSPDALLFQVGKGTKGTLCYMGQVRTENRHSLVVKTAVSQITGTTERPSAVGLADGRGGGIVLRWARTRPTTVRALWRTWRDERDGARGAD